MHLFERMQRKYWVSSKKNETEKMGLEIVSWCNFCIDSQTYHTKNETVQCVSDLKCLADKRVLEAQNYRCPLLFLS